MVLLQRLCSLSDYHQKRRHAELLFLSAACASVQITDSFQIPKRRPVDAACIECVWMHLGAPKRRHARRFWQMTFRDHGREFQTCAAASTCAKHASIMARSAAFVPVYFMMSIHLFLRVRSHNEPTSRPAPCLQSIMGLLQFYTLHQSHKNEPKSGLGFFFLCHNQLHSLFQKQQLQPVTL